MKISLKEILKTSWKQVKKNFKFLLPFFLGISIVSVILGWNGSDDMFSAFSIASILVSPILYYLTTKVSLKISKDEKVGWKDLFSDFNQKIYLSFLAVSIFINIAIIILGAIGVFVGISIPLVGPFVFLVFFLALFIFFMGVILFSYYRLVDIESDFWKAIKDSFALAKGNRLFLIKFMIVAFLLNLLGVLLLGIGLLVTFPITSIAIAHIYNKIKIKN
ncbi:MAG: hypothetical protein R3B55_00205 [Candidatus Paceibacterota bacterium]